jgi:hypothetical protein
LSAGDDAGLRERWSDEPREHGGKGVREQRSDIAMNKGSKGAKERSGSGWEEEAPRNVSIRIVLPNIHITSP